PLCLDCSCICHSLHPQQLAFPTRRSSDLITLVLGQFIHGLVEPRYAPRLQLVLPGPAGSRHAACHLPLWRCQNKTGQQCIVLTRSEEHTSELQSRENLVCRLLLEKNIWLT